MIKCATVRLINIFENYRLKYISREILSYLLHLSALARLFHTKARDPPRIPRLLMITYQELPTADAVRPPSDVPVRQKHHCESFGRSRFSSHPACTKHSLPRARSASCGYVTLARRIEHSDSTLARIDLSPLKSARSKHPSLTFAAGRARVLR